MALTYGASTTITVTLNSLANGSARQATKVDNTANLWLDALAQVTVKTAAGSLGTTPVVSVYAYGSLDGTTWADGVTGADAAWTAPTNITGALVGQIPLDAAATAKTYRLMDIALAFGGTLPPFWTLVFVNSTGLALDSSAGGTASYVGAKV